jgi:hypothetical protein
MALRHLAVGRDEVERRVVDLDDGEMPQHSWCRQAEHFGEEPRRRDLVASDDDRVVERDCHCRLPLACCPVAEGRAAIPPHARK